MLPFCPPNVDEVSIGALGILKNPEF